MNTNTAPSAMPEHTTPGRFCSQCGAAVATSARFCSSCGELVQAQAQAPPPPRMATRPWLRLGRLVAGSLLVGLLAGVAVLLLGWPVDVVDEPTAETSSDSDSVATGYLTSAYYDEVIDQYGYPHTWWVADGTNSPGQQPVRAEQWFYPEQGLWVWFIDGWRGPEEYFTPEEAIFDSYTDVTPTDLNRTMTLDDLDTVIGAERQWLGPVSTEVGDLDTWAYPEAGLVVQLLDGRFFSAQTI